MNLRILFVLLLPALLFSFRIPDEIRPMTPKRKVPISHFSILVINCPATIILEQTFNADTVRVYGDKDFIDKIIFRQTGDRLVIGAKTTRDLKNKVIVHIPLHFLETLEINSSASVMSVVPVFAEKLDVTVNGSCKLDIAVTGKLVITESAYYDFKYRSVFSNASSVPEKNYNIKK